MLKEVAKGVALKLKDVFGFKEREYKKLEAMLVQNLYDLLRMGKYTRRTMIFVMNEFWYSCLLHAYALTDEFTLYPILLTAEIAPASSKTFEIDLTGTNLCCVCPIYYAAANLGDEVLLSCLINESPVDVKRQWQNKYLPENEPMTTEMTSHPFVIFPKRKLKITFENTNDTETAKAKFYVPGMLIDFEKGKNLIEVCHEEVVKEFMVATGIIREEEAYEA